MDRDLPKDEVLLAPPFRGGAIALFPAPDPAASPDSSSSSATARRRSRRRTGASRLRHRPDDPSGLGGDGAFYVGEPPPGNYAARSRGDGLRCRATLHAGVRDAVIKSGVTTCTAVTEMRGGLAGESPGDRVVACAVLGLALAREGGMHGVGERRPSAATASSRRARHVHRHVTHNCGNKDLTTSRSICRRIERLVHHAHAQAGHRTR